MQALITINRLQKGWSDPCVRKQFFWEQRKKSSAQGILISFLLHKEKRDYEDNR